MSRAEAIAFFRERGESYKVEILEGDRRGPRVALSPGRLHRPLPRPPRRVDGPDQGLQAPVLVGRLLAGRREEPDAVAHLRDGLAHRRRISIGYLWRLEEAKKRDHRKLGRELDLFEFHDVSPGARLLAAQRHDPGPRARAVLPARSWTPAATRRSPRRSWSTSGSGSSPGTGSSTARTCSRSRWRRRSSASSP